ncbi:hypothetical protein EJ05DRAFT_511333 [Pseudovirgaria hyperparasitica]|uniref:Heterokaryon incompatibility domain-containing protein n=1 Tax=Pseudovirgaria hyperparasitica TaxID=470096 RepID=A0A6A6W6J9_9PEZI|nr:uncharacterized protein EJ05DRAFT_511333 [Pseudovirgaria hyperparasitica]KAF2757536.1 hypothetical protein EJ05DRAFT_511333 [Pseudovirgaria hyperparasitica]
MALQDNDPLDCFSKPRKTRAKPTPVKPAKSEDAEIPTNPSQLIRWRDAFEKAQNKFKYDDIDAEKEVRLLLLYAGKSSTPIQVSLRTISMDLLGKKFHYDALSYYWGDGPQIDPVFIRPVKNQRDGKDIKIFEDVYRASTFRIKVKRNLYSALQHLREENEDVILWIDAICINQQNQQEKEAQVARMAHIYRQASNVCIWLGHSNERCSNAMDFITRILGTPNLDDFVRKKEHVQRWLDLAHLMRSDWFTRRWVIQELALAKEAVVHFGDRTISWDDLKDAVGLFSLHFDTIQQNFADADQRDMLQEIGELDLLGAQVLVDVIGNVFRRKADGTIYEPVAGLETLVSSLSTFNSSDPRDTIIALRNLAKETSGMFSRGTTRYAPPPPPDYTKSVLVVYKEFVKWVVTTSKSLNIICRHWALPPRVAESTLDPNQLAMSTELPSWVKKISESKYGAMLDGRSGRKSADDFVGLPGHSAYNASYNIEAEVYFGATEYKTGLKPRTPLLPHGFVSLSDRTRQPSIPIRRETENHTQLFGLFGEPLSASDMADQSPWADQYIPTSKSPQSSQFPSVKDGTTMQPINGTQPGRHALLNGTAEDEETPQAEAGAQEVNMNGHTSHIPKPLAKAILQVQKQQPNKHDAAPVDSDMTKKCEPSSVEAVEAEDSSIFARGIQISTITFATNPIADGVIPQKAIHLGGYNKNSEYSQIKAPDKLWRTLVADRGPDGGPTPAWYHRACLECLINDTVNGHINVKQLLESKKKLQHVRKFLERVRSIVWERVIFEADPMSKQSNRESLFGLGPATTLTNDIVCILFGCTVPVILREQKDEHDEVYYEFVGEAFVYGMMDGEAVTSMSEEELQERATYFRLM